MSIDTTSGNARVSGSFERVDVNTVSGNINIHSAKMLEGFKTSSISGDITLTIPENDGFTVDFNKVTGKFKSDFSFAIQGDTHIYKNGETRFNASTVSGNLDIVRR